VVARVVPAEGRSRAYLNGRVATAATLAEALAPLVEVHGQHGQRALAAAAAQRQALDRFGAVDLDPWRTARRALADVDAALGALGGDARGRAREVDLLTFQVAELSRAGLVDQDEDEGLEREEDLLAGAEVHRVSASAAHRALVADDGGALAGVAVAAHALSGRSPFQDVATRLAAVSAELTDLAADLRTAADAIEEDPERLAAVLARRQLLRELRRKYGETVADVMAYHRAAAVRLNELGRYEARGAALEAQRTAAMAQVQAAAAAVGEARRGTSGRLAAAVAAQLGALGMASARLEVTVGDTDPGDEVTFLLGANRGEPALPLAKAASGGELARTMLALRLVLTEGPGTLVFDEVDAGVGGEAALAVGRALAEVAARHQVLVVTHLAQVAAFADAQVAVDKHVVGGRTEARVMPVVDGERVRELSRMLSGMADSGPAHGHATELLAAASRQRGQSPGER
jgi:DNA repair protein RecN (Recombination protein N)